MQSPARAFARVIFTVSIAVSDEHRAEFFAVTALAAVTDLPAIGWDDAPGRVVIVGDVDQINNFIQPKIRLLARAWGVALPDPSRMIYLGSRPQQGAVLPGHHRSDGHAGRAGCHPRQGRRGGAPAPR